MKNELALFIYKGIWSQSHYILKNNSGKAYTKEVAEEDPVFSE